MSLPPRCVLENLFVSADSAIRYLHQKNVFYTHKCGLKYRIGLHPCKTDTKVVKIKSGRRGFGPTPSGGQSSAVV